MAALGIGGHCHHRVIRWIRPVVSSPAVSHEPWPPGTGATTQRPVACPCQCECRCPVGPTGEYAFAQEVGGTRLSFSLDAPLSGLKKLLMGAVQSTINGEMAAPDRLEAALED